VVPGGASHHAGGAIDFRLTAWLDGSRSMAGPALGHRSRWRPPTTPENWWGGTMGAIAQKSRVWPCGDITSWCVVSISTLE